tara:strand:+ start:486 stop:896 length:411 start_codon:yes stop_codon:yes gene_type:complete
MNTDENILWTARPSQVTNLVSYIFLFWTIVVPIVVYLKTRFTVYELTNKRLRLRTGVLTQTIEETELYRIRDYHIVKPILLRIFGLGNLHIYSEDKSSEQWLVLHAIKDVEKIKDLLRNNVEEVRKQTGTREIDIS